MINTKKMKLICAPMATLSHEPFRLLIDQFGCCDEYFTEMINASSLVNMGPFEKYYLLNGPCPQKIVWQLTGASAASLAEATKIVLENGGIGIDINMGCSAPQIYKTGAGIAWMLKPLSETIDAVQAVHKELGNQFRLSVKCRLGDEDFTESSFFDFTDALVQNGVSLITLHPRTIKEKYRGLPKYEFAEKLVQRYENKVQVYLNGCIKDFESASFALQKAPSVDGLMIARAAAERPWIFAQLKKEFEKAQKKIVIDRKKVALDFIDYVEQFQPKEFYKTRIQRFFSYYCNQFSFAHYFQSKMLNYKSLEESRNEICDYFSKQSQEQFIEV